MFAEVFSGNVACHLNSLEESTSFQLPCVWGREILQGRNNPGRCAAPWGRQAKHASLTPECQCSQEMTPCQINSESEVRDGGWKESLPHKWNLQNYGRETTTYSLWICPTPVAPQTSVRNILQTVDQQQGLPFMQALSDIQTFFCVWKHSVISGFVYGSSSIWRRLKSLMRAEGPAAFSLRGTWRPFQRQQQPLHRLIVSALPRCSSQ